MFVININAAFIFCFLRGGPSFSCEQSPLYICFIPKTFFIKTKMELFLYFDFVLVVNLIVSFLFIERLHSFVD